MDKLPGTLTKDLVYTGRNIEQGTEFTYHIYLSPLAKKAKKGTLALHLLLEQDPDKLAPLMNKFMEDGIIPPGLVVFAYPGFLNPTLKGGAKRLMRAEEYDQYGRVHADLLVEELVPAAAKAAKVVLDPSPDMHFIAGVSSGGMISWNAVWFRNDYFRRCYLNSPTLSPMRGGEDAMVIVRKTESRPVRIYMTAGSEEPDYFFGNSLVAAQNAASTFEFAGYDFRYERFDGKGHGCCWNDSAVWRRVCTFVWANWKTDPVKTLGSQIRVRQLVEDGCTWEKTKEPMPKKKGVATPFGEYTFRDGKIYLIKNGKKKVAADGFAHITGIRLSVDQWRLYIADSGSRFIYAMSVMPDGMLAQKYEHSPLHISYYFHTVGAMDLEILENDRVLAATELGIQGILSFGITDLILPLPGDLPADGVAVKGKMLYASSNGTVFRRKIKFRENDPAKLSLPTTPEYIDDFDFSRSHFTPA